jgi:hypothetical protein
VVFPSPHLDNPRLGVKWRYVRDGLYEERRNFPDAKRIADAVVWHMTTCPEESLGVVTLNGTQRNLVEELLELRLRSTASARNTSTAGSPKDGRSSSKTLRTSRATSATVS